MKRYPRKPRFIESEQVAAWISQFRPKDQSLAKKLVEKVLLVSADQFALGIRKLILQKIKDSSGPIALFVERSLGNRKYLYKQTSGKKKSAFGAAPQPAQATKAYSPEVGSEGLIAQLITEICREHPKHAFMHPTAKTVREKKVRRIVLVTDIIGSGRRVSKYLDAAWRVRSIRSWTSLKLVRFEVITYTATKAGTSAVKDHATRPKLHVVAGCPTIRSEFSKKGRQDVRTLCMRYDPIGADSVDSLGFEGSGVLVAFAHGAPNNMPRLFYEKNPVWAPLFPKRVTAESRSKFGKIDDQDTVTSRLQLLGQKRLARAPWVSSIRPASQALILFLASLSRGPRTDEVLSLRTGLNIDEVQAAAVSALSHGWIDSRRRLTDRGHSELIRAKKGIKPRAPVQVGVELYYPSSLRAPRASSS